MEKYALVSRLGSLYGAEAVSSRSFVRSAEGDIPLILPKVGDVSPRVVSGGPAIETGGVDIVRYILVPPAKVFSPKALLDPVDSPSVTADTGGSTTVLTVFAVETGAETGGNASAGFCLCR